jgi:hypothetical protein
MASGGTSLSCQVDSEYTSSVNFEWDEDKNQENIRKHGFDFADAWEIFEAPIRAALDAREDYGAKFAGMALVCLGIGLSSWCSPNAAKIQSASSLCERH